MTRCKAWLLRLFTLQLAFVLFVGCNSTGPEARSAEATPRVAPAEQPKLFFWNVKTASSTVYLLGSVHVATEDMYPLDPKIEQAFQEAESLSLEIVMDDETQLEAAQKLVAAASYPPGDNLLNHVSQATLARLDAKAHAAGLPMAFLKNFRPWFVAISLTMAELNRLGFDAELGIDEHFRRQAESTKRLSSIESVDSQVALFTSLSSETQEDNLEQALDEIDSLGPEMAKAIELWKRGDAAGLEKLLLDPMRRQYPDLFHRLFVERNVKMADAVEALLAQPGSHFVIVGGGHLVGDQGVIDLLMKRGHSVAQLAASHTTSPGSAAPATP